MEVGQDPKTEVLVRAFFVRVLPLDVAASAGSGTTLQILLIIEEAGT
jgi:hypothetical protein